MPVRFWELSVREYVNLVGPFILAFLIGVAARIVHPIYPVQWLPASTVHALADAFVVAGVIGALIELYSVRFLIQRVADDLGERLVGRGLPTELQGQIGKIVKITVVRDRFVKSFCFSDPNEGYVKIDIKVTFDVRNYSDSVQSYSPSLSEESFYEPEFLSVEYGVDEGVPRSYNRAELLPFVKTDPEIKAKSVVDLPVITLDSNKKNPAAICRVIWRYRVTMREDYSDIMSFSGPTIGFSIHADRIPEGFEFFSSGERMRHLRGSSSWDFDRSFLPGQYVRAWWFRKRDRASVHEAILSRPHALRHSRRHRRSNPQGVVQSWLLVAMAHFPLGSKVTGKQLNATSNPGYFALSCMVHARCFSRHWARVSKLRAGA